MYKKIDKITKDEIYDLYVTQNLSMKQIARIKGVSYGTINNAIQKYGIAKPAELIRGQISEHTSKRFERVGYRDKETLFDLYITQNKTMEQIAEMYGVGSGTISQWVKKYNIHKDKQVVYEQYKATCVVKYGVYHNSHINIPKQTLEVLETKEGLREYILANENKSATALSEKLGFGKSNFLLKCHKFGLYDLLDKTKFSYEEEIKEIFAGFGISLKKKRNAFDRYEIDLYSEKHKIGIEFNGDYWHSEKFLDKNYHQKKSLCARDNGIFIYHIFEYEWNDPNTRVKIINQLRNLFGINENKIYARNCTVREISTVDKNEFLNKYHLQGADISSIKYGLFHNNELVSVMTFCKPRFNKNFGIELSRYCCKANTNVVGGAQKLFSCFCKHNSWQNIISYSDIAKTKGNIYEILGFAKIKISPPSYVWKNKDKIKSRYQCQMVNENDTMRKIGYSKIYNCGNFVWGIENVNGI